MKVILDYFKGRLTSQKIITIAAIVTIPLQFWSFYSLFEDFSAWTPIFDAWDLLGAWSYTFLFVIAEVIIVTGYLLLLNLIVPKRLARGAYVQISFVIVLEITITALLIHFNSAYFRSVEEIFWGLIAVSVLTTGLIGFLPQKFLGFISNIADRFVTLAMFFWFFDIIALIIVVIRNIF